jgi:hypothetical protein
MVDPAASLQLLPPVRIWLRLLNGKYVAYPVFLSDTIATLEAALKVREPFLCDEGGPRSDLTFVFADRELRPDEIFSACGIVNDSVIQLIPAGELAEDYDSWVIIVTERGRFRLGNRNNETVGALIERIKDTEYISPSSVVFAGQPLPWKRTFEACGVPTGAILTVPSIARIGVIVKAHADKMLRIWARPDDMTYDLKEFIQNTEGIPPDQQRLLYRGRALEDSRPLGMYGIGPRSELHLLTRLRG